MYGARALVRSADRQSWLDTSGRQLQAVVRRTFAALGDRQRPVEDLLHGKWLGHPLHPVLTDATIGFLTASTTFDLLAWLGMDGVRRAADLSLMTGLALVPVTAMVGLTDWQYARDRTIRTGMAHALSNVTGAALYGASLLLRTRGARNAACMCALAGTGALTIGAYLGGSLVYDDRMGMNHRQPVALPEEFVTVLAEHELREGEPRGVEMDGLRVVLVRQGGEVYALPAVCPHLGGPLEQGRVEDGSIICPLHGSRYDLRDGRAIDGPSVYPQPPLEVRVLDGQIAVRAAR